MANRARRAKVSKARGTAHTQTFFVRSPTSGILDTSIVSGVTVTEDEKLPRKWRYNTNTRSGDGGIGNRPYLREGLGQ